jgi:hypothetical protein
MRSYHVQWGHMTQRMHSEPADYDLIAATIVCLAAHPTTEAASLLHRPPPPPLYKDESFASHWALQTVVS